MAVLLIEDDDDLRAMTAQVLRVRGYEVREARSGLEGVALATAESALTTALVDLGLPDIDGLEVAARLNALGRAIRLVALTGQDASDIASRCFEVGFVQLVTKPANLERIVAAIGQP